MGLYDDTIETEKDANPWGTIAKSPPWTGDGFPYFWLGQQAESIPTPWRTAWLAKPLTKEPVE
jgi:hypothetical protein